MFYDIGKKIKALAVAVCWIGIFLSIISGIIMMVCFIDTHHIIRLCLGFIIIVLGCFSSWIGSFFTYGFGELIDKASETATYAREMYIFQSAQYKEMPKEKETDPNERWDTLDIH